MATSTTDFDLGTPKPSSARLTALRYARRVRDLIELARLHRPIGIWLLLWPVLWAVWIAGDAHPNSTVFWIFVLGTIAMRSAGCVINDLADRDFDPFVKRTRDRPIASRRIAPVEAVVWFLVLIGIALALVLKLDESTIRMSVIGAVLMPNREVKEGYVAHLFATKTGQRYQGYIVREDANNRGRPRGTTEALITEGIESAGR